jgi:hypothetical protein
VGIYVRPIIGVDGCISRIDACATLQQAHTLDIQFSKLPIHVLNKWYTCLTMGSKVTNGNKYNQGV